MSASTRSRRRTWYNENDPQIVAWLRELRAEGLIPDGAIDERSIEDVGPNDCAPTSHFFAGIAGWAYALQLAGWPASAPIWTGSCPCQPFSSAGKREGFADKRHLWPAWRDLIAQCRPPAILGEQVDGKLGREWLARVRSDLEAMGYAVGCAGLCAAGIGAPGIRQRLWWVADTEGERYDGRNSSTEKARRAVAQNSSALRGLAYTQGSAPRPRHDLRERQSDAGASRGVGDAYMPDQNRRTPIGGQPLYPKRKKACGVGDASGARPQERKSGEGIQRTQMEALTEKTAERAGNPWGEFDLLPCADGKSRRVEPGTFPLAHGIPARMVRLRGYGNAIVPQVAAVFVRAYMEARGLA